MNWGEVSPSQRVSENQKPCSAGQNTQMLSTVKGTRTKATSSGDSRWDCRRRPRVARVRVRDLVERVTVTSALEDLLGGLLPIAQDRVDLVGLVDELGERGVRGRLEGVAGVAVEELREFLGAAQHRLALGDQRRLDGLGLRVGGERDAGAVLVEELERLSRRQVLK